MWKNRVVRDLPTGIGALPKAKHTWALGKYPGMGILFVAWTILGVLSYIRYRLLPGAVHEDFVFGMLEWLSCYYPWLFLTPLIFRMERRFPIVEPFSTKHAAWLALLGFPTCYGAYLAASVIGRVMHLLVHRWVVPAPFTWRMPASEVALQFALYTVTVGASAFLRHLAQTQQMELQSAALALEKSRLESALRQAELETLRMRLNPHFLFNCLQNISALAGQDAKAASQMLMRLGDLLRVALRSDYQAEIALDEEVALTKAYVSIEQVRHGNRLSVLFDIAPQTERALVPSLLLQPLVENAIKHGLSGRDREGVIWVRSALQDAVVVVTIRDNGRGLRKEDAERLRLGVEGGVGLGATRERLLRMYGDQQTLRLQSLPEGGTEVRITLPLRAALHRTAAEDAQQSAADSSAAAVIHGAG